MEEFDPVVCDEKHKAMSTRLTIIMWMIGILILIMSASAKFMVVASQTAESVRSELALRKQELASEDQRLNREIELARIEAKADLTMALKIFGYDMQDAQNKMMTIVEKNTEKLSIVSFNISAMTTAINEIQKETKK